VVSDGGQVDGAAVQARGLRQKYYTGFSTCLELLQADAAPEYQQPRNQIAALLHE